MTNNTAPIEKKLFISHSSKDKNKIWPIIEELTAFGVGVWVDALEMKPGSKLFREISEGIGMSRYVAVMISKESVQSEWVKEEIQQAMSDEFYDKSIKLIPCILEECEIPRFLRDRIYCDFTKSQFHGITQLLGRVYDDGHIVPANINFENPVQLSINDTKNHLARIYGLTRGSQRIYFVLDSLDMLNDISKLWDDLEDDIARLRPGLEEMYARQRLRLKETIPYMIRNLGISYFLIADVVNQYIGRSATQISDMIEHLQRATQFILYDIWSAIFRNVPQENFNRLSTLSYKSVNEYFNTIESQSEENRIPPRKVEQYLFNCKPDELVDIGLQGRDGINSCRIDVPIFSIPADTQNYMGQPGGLSLRPDSEIFRDKWLRYFVPQIIRYHVRECSNSGQYLGHFLKNISVKKEDYVHLGYS